MIDVNAFLLLLANGKFLSFRIISLVAVAGVAVVLVGLGLVGNRKRGVGR